MENKYIKKGIECFFNKSFDTALLNFSLALRESDSKEARLGAILSDLAKDKEAEAGALFEYYLLSRDSGVKNSEAIVEEILDSVELSLEDIEKLFLENEIEIKINEENGIAYSDFMSVVHAKNNFKEAFENIMFSTKVIIHTKKDFLDFLEQLIENGFTDISLNYLESALAIFPNDPKLTALIKKVK